jgi:16S rRNA (guanine527-N7)-methyltransferase
MDLTSVDTPEEIVSRHYCESLFFAQALPRETDPKISIIDFGSGAGFPGVPMAILHPEWRVYLVEANQRRAVFLKEACRGVNNVSVDARRGEQFDEKCDWIVARAVKLADVLSCVPRLALRAGLLVSTSTLSDLSKSCSWSQAIRIPWSHSKCCVFGECST